MAPEHNWFVTRSGSALQLDHETPERMYFGPKSSGWKGRERQDFIPKSNVLAGSLCAEAAAEIASIYTEARKQEIAVNRETHDALKKIRERRAMQVDKILARVSPNPSKGS